MSTQPFTLPRFSGSTLEPTVEPLVLYPRHPHQINPIKLHYHKNSNAVQPSGSLQRKGRPTFIEIPPSCKEFVPKERDTDEFSPWSCEDANEPMLLWDEVTQTIYKAPSSNVEQSPFFPSYASSTSSSV